MTKFGFGVTVVVISIVTSALLVPAAASAAFCEPGADETSANYVVCVKGAPYLGVLENDNSAVKSTLKGTPLGVATELEGTTGFIEIKSKDEGASEGLINLVNVKVLKPANCSVPLNQVVLNFVGQLTNPPAPIENKLRGKEAGEEWNKIKFEGAACALGGQEIPLKGVQTCTISGPAVPALAHEVTCPATASNLKFGAKVATFNATFKEVDTNTMPEEEWSILES